MGQEAQVEMFTVIHVTSWRKLAENFTFGEQLLYIHMKHNWWLWLSSVFWSKESCYCKLFNLARSTCTWRVFYNCMCISKLIQLFVVLMYKLFCSTKTNWKMTVRSDDEPVLSYHLKSQGTDRSALPICKFYDALFLNIIKFKYTILLLY